MKQDEVCVAVIGAGPGGLQLSAALQEFGIDYSLLERGSDCGNFFTTMPRKRRLISLNKVHVGDETPEARLRWDWNSLVGDTMPRFARYDQDYHPSADSLVHYFRDFAVHHDLKILRNCDVLSVARFADGRFRLMSADGRIIVCSYIVVATGLFNPLIPDIAGIEHAIQYPDVPDKADSFTNKRVLVIGKGNSAFETADWLLPYASNIHMVSPEPDRMAARTHFVGDARSVNYAFLDTAFFKQQNAFLNATIQRITPKDGKHQVEMVYSENDEFASVPYDSVICCTGFEFSDEIFDECCRPAVDPETHLPKLRGNWESANVDNMFFAGTLMQANDYRKSSTPFIKGIRHNARSLANILAERALGADWPAEVIDPSGLRDHILQRIRNSASLWHVWNGLCDVYVLDAEGDAIIHNEDVPQIMVFEDRKYIGRTILALRFGHHYPAGALSAACGEDPYVFIHPILYLVGSDGAMIAETHFDEDVEDKWEDPIFWSEPLTALIEAAFQAAGRSKSTNAAKVMADVEAID